MISFLGLISAYSIGPQTKFYGNKYGNKKRAQQHGGSLTNANLATATEYSSSPKACQC